MPRLSLLSGLLRVLGVGGDRVRRIGVGDEGLVVIDDDGELGSTLVLLLLSLLLVVLGGSLLLLVVLLEGVRSRSSVVGVLGILHSVSDLDELVIDVAESGLDGLFDGGSDSLSDETSSERRENLREQEARGDCQRPAGKNKGRRWKMNLPCKRSRALTHG
jgi:hypothetical protein